MAKTTFIIADPSVLIRKGMAAVIRKLELTEIIHEIDQKDDLVKLVNRHKPDILIINPILFKNDSTQWQFSDRSNMKLILLHPTTPEHLNTACDAHISYLDPQSHIIKILTQLRTTLQEQPSQGNTDPLSSRETMILKQIALGLTNKEIADKLYISIHTVVTHRKHITQKLGIKSVSGLTVYAILNNLISMDEVQ